MPCPKVSRHRVLMSTPIIIGILAVVIVVVLATTIRGRGSRTTATGRQSGLIVVVAGLVLYYALGRR